MEQHSDWEQLTTGLHQMRDTLTQLSLLLKDYQANVDHQCNGQARAGALNALAQAKQAAALRAPDMQGQRPH